MLSFNSVSKAFTGVQALDNVSFSVRPGSIHALCGENGAGKSTLLKVLSGVYQPESGHIEIDGEIRRFRSTAEALQAGIAVIYQELNLVPEMSIAENVWLGHPFRKGPFVDRWRLAEETTKLLRVLGLEAGPWTRVGTLPLAQRQLVEIAKALSRNARIIAFDEPTSSLSTREVETLFSLIRSLRDKGLTLLYVSHRLEEVLKLSDACTVLRDGKHVETFQNMDGVDAQAITQRMVGRELRHAPSEAPTAYGPPVLEVESVSGPSLSEPVSFFVRQGEILGIFGLVGAGRTELLKAVYMGTSGSVRLFGRPVPRKGPQASIGAGLVFCPEDRKKEGIIPMLSVSENLNLSIRRSLARLRFWLDRRREHENADRFVQRLRIRTASLNNPIATLSGGNQQKVILARWLGEAVRAILFDEPTRGIDVGAKAEIFGLIRELAAQGIGIVFASSELPEVLALSHRVLVMCEGRITGEMPTSEATEQRILELALPKSTTSGAHA